MLFWGMVLRSPDEYTAWQWPRPFLRNTGDHLPYCGVMARKVNNMDLHCGTSNFNFSLWTSKENVSSLETQQPQMSIEVTMLHLSNTASQV
jgi:hypothetical protein